MRFVFLSIFFISTLFAKDMVYRDTNANLVWEDTPHTEENDIKWAMAKSYCASLYLDGSDAWRLPTKKELYSLAKLTKKGVFEYGSDEAYWSSQEYEADDLNAWALYLKTEHPFDDDKCNTAHVRCVR